jgi:hypothetical protein
MKGILLIAGALAIVVALGHMAGRQNATRSGAAPAARTAILTPETEAFFRLDTPSDRDTFRLWFAHLAEEIFFRDPAALPRDVTDCSALVRYAYREALARHDGQWAESIGLRRPPPLPSVAKYQYPDTPVGPNLFRVDASQYAQFADARTLREWNSRLVSRRAADALPGDLLFFRQLAQDMPFHVMIVLGPSRIEDAAGPFVVYHTGPSSGHRGEIRRPSLADLEAHPEPRWRPLPGNSNFLGVYRWNILSD